MKIDTHHEMVIKNIFKKFLILKNQYGTHSFHLKMKIK